MLVGVLVYTVNYSIPASAFRGLQVNWKIGKDVSRKIKVESTDGNFWGVPNKKAMDMVRYGEAILHPQVDALVSLYGPQWTSALLRTGKTMFSRERKNQTDWIASGLVISSSLTGYEDMD